jgi:hypothetical protein
MYESLKLQLVNKKSHKTNEEKIKVSMHDL